MSAAVTFTTRSASSPLSCLAPGRCNRSRPIHFFYHRPRFSSLSKDPPNMGRDRPLLRWDRFRQTFISVGFRSLDILSQGRIFVRCRVGQPLHTEGDLQWTGLLVFTRRLDRTRDRGLESLRMTPAEVTCWTETRRDARTNLEGLRVSCGETGRSEKPPFSRSVLANSSLLPYGTGHDALSCQ